MRTLMAGVTGLVALSLGCGAGRSSPSEPTPQAGPGQTAPAGRGQTNVVIDNENFNDMDIYVIDAGTRVYLGAVTGLSRITLVVPRGASRSQSRVLLLADPIGGLGPITTPDLIVGPGQTVYWTLGLTPAASFASAG